MNLHLQPVYFYYCLFSKQILLQLDYFPRLLLVSPPLHFQIFILLAMNQNSILILIDWEINWISTVSMNRTYSYVFMSKLSMPRNICWHWGKLMQSSLNLYYWINLPSRTGWLNADCLWRRIPSPCCSWELLGILLDGVFVPLPKTCQTSS